MRLPRSRHCPPRPRCAAKQIKLQVALITPLMHVKGYAAPETKAAVERARLLIEQAEALGEPSEDPLLLFSVLYGILGRQLFRIQRRRDRANWRRSSWPWLRTKERQSHS